MIDLLCENYFRAEQNRKMVSLKLNISAYIRIESLVRSWPRNKRLPEELLGSIPSIGKRESLHGFHEVN